MTEEVIPKYLESAYKMVSLAFPDGISDDDYSPLLAILADEMSEECLTNFMEYFLQDFDAIFVSNDIAKALSTHRPPSKEIERVKKLLEGAGYEDWLLDVQV